MEKYQETIDNIKNFKDLKKFIERVYISEDSKDFIELFIKNRNKFESIDVIYSGNMLLYTLGEENDVEQLKKEIEYYKNLPYISQEVEEWASDLNVDKFIDKVVQPDKKGSYSIEKISDIVRNGDILSIALFISDIENGQLNNVDSSSLIASELMKRKEYDMGYSLILNHLIFERFDLFPINFDSPDLKFSIIPSELYKKYKASKKYVAKVSKELRKNAKNITLGLYAIKLLDLVSTYLIYEIPTKDNINSIVIAVLDACFDIFKEKDMDGLYQEYLKLANNDEIKHYRKILSKIIKY